MYPEFEKVNTFLAKAGKLLNGPKTMESIYHETFTNNRKKVAVEYFNSKGKIKHYKYSKMQINAESIAYSLSKKLKGVEKHRPIILKFSNNQHWPEVFWAILMCGYKPLLIDAKTSKEGTANLFNQSKAVAVISEDPYLYDFKKISAIDLIEERVKGKPEFDWENEVIFSSSGTTGDVKLMVVNGENLCNQICCALDMSKETKDLMYPDSMGKIKILAMIPFHHIFGFVAVFLWFTFYGKTLIFPVSNTPSDLQAACQKMGATHVFSVPLFWDAIALGVKRKAAMANEETKALLEKMIKYNLGQMNKQDAGLAASSIARNKVQKALLGNKVRYCISGGGFLSQETLSSINGIGYNLYNGYGMTEIGVTSVELSPDVNTRLKASIGRPLHGVEYKIDGENGKGELLIKSPTVHIREIIGGVEGPANLTEDGYFRSGDIAEVDENGEYYLRGRIKDIIINADGENIFPDELEIFFKGLSHVIHLSVMGIAIPGSHNETISLVLELDNSVEDKDLTEIKEQVNAIKLPHGCKIGAIYLSKGKLPIANNMKVKRFIIKKAIESGSNEYMPIDGKKEQNKVEGFDEQTIKEIVEPMRELFAKVLILPKFKIEDNAHWINDLGGDSMSYVELVREVENKFNITFPDEVLGQMANVNDFAHEVAKLKKDKQVNNK